MKELPIWIKLVGWAIIITLLGILGRNLFYDPTAWQLV